MRKQDVFGRKINQARPYFFIVIIFAIVVPLHFLILNLQEERLADLKTEELAIQAQIDAILLDEQAETYQDIGQIIPYLPNTYSRQVVTSELTYVKNLVGLSGAVNYQISFVEDADSPFEDDLPSSIQFVRVSISMTMSNPDKVFEYIDALLAQDRLYYIDAVQVSLTDTDEAIVTYTIYTFYNNVDLS